MSEQPFATTLPSLESEWLETDGRGGYSSGTVGLVRTRRYHALLLVAATPPTQRCALVSGCDVRLATARGVAAFSTQRYAPDVLSPDGIARLRGFSLRPWPSWAFRLPDGRLLYQELLVARGAPGALIRWQLPDARPGDVLLVRPFLAMRGHHDLRHGEAGMRLDGEPGPGQVVWTPVDGLPSVVARFDGEYRADPSWYRHFFYQMERQRGMDAEEDLGSPGIFRWDLSQGAAHWALAPGSRQDAATEPLRVFVERTMERERARRAALANPLARAADSYLVDRGSGKTIIAGYPWFTDWGRDTFIALRGLCIATERLEQARAVLLEWAGAVSEGMIPNHFADIGGEPQFNSVDASLWFIITADAFRRAVGNGNPELLSAADDAQLQEAIHAILSGYRRGTRFGIHADADGLLAAGEPGTALTWMDAVIEGRPVTPRIGKPVEVQALWINALRIAGRQNAEWRTIAAQATASFRNRFWNESAGALYDVVDLDHEAGTTDDAIRPNQIFAVGGLPFALIEGDLARRVVDTVEQQLWTPAGMRTLAPADARYVGRYEGDGATRDAAYHQGAAWPWLIGAFVDGWVRVRGGDAATRREARSRFLEPLLARLHENGLDHLSELADGDAPHLARGAPFQAWSLGEALWLDRQVLAEPTARHEP